MSQTPRVEVRRWITATIAALALGAVVLAHPGDGMETDVQGAFDGPIFAMGDIAAPGVDFEASDVQLLSWLPVTTFGSQMTSGNVCWGYVSPSGREYAIMGLSHGTGFVEVTDPYNPVIVGTFPGPQSLWRDVKAYDHYAYAVSEAGEGIQVFNLETIDEGVVTFVGAVTTGGAVATHTVAVNEASGYLYRCGGASNKSVRSYSLADPAQPAFVTSFAPARYVHECHPVTYTAGPYAGREIVFLFCEDTSGGQNAGVDVYDVTDKGDIFKVSSIAYSNATFSHQGWLSEDKVYLYVDDELDGLPNTRVIKVDDLENPVEVGSFTNGLTAIDHNLYVRGTLIFESNYRSGLRVFDASADQVHPVEIAHFDTFPTDDMASFNGLWSNYPYLPSGIILGSDIEKGLFVWRLGPPLLNFTYPGGVPEFVAPVGQTLALTIAPGDGVLKDGTAELHYRSGDKGDFVTTPLTDLGGGQFLANLSGGPCGEHVEFFFTAETTTGLPVRDPINAYHAMVAYGETVAFDDAMETDTGWIVGTPADNATSGIWVRVDPNGTEAQPEDDSDESPGTMCWVTGQGPPGGLVGQADVDGGLTSLTSPVFDALAGDEPSIVYHRWYSNNKGDNPNTDSLLIEISNNGSTWIPLEIVSDNLASWTHREYRVADYVVPTETVRIRFRASDYRGGSIIEAGVDDVRLEFLQCDDPADFNGDGVIDGADLGLLLAAWGAPGATDLTGDGITDGSDLGLLLASWPE